MVKVTDLYLIGIDGGGTRTRGILVRGGKVLSRAETGSTRLGVVGYGEATERLLNIIEELCDKANIAPADVAATTIGLAGVWLEYEGKRFEHLLRMIGRERQISLQYLNITSDAAIALEGALEGSPGIVLIVGTGTIAIAKCPDGAIVRCGGWGIEIDDEGSGAWIGKEGLAAVARALDGRGPQTVLVQKMAELFPMFHPDEPRSLVAAFYEREFDYQTLAPLVQECAEAGDPVASAIIQRAVEHLLLMIRVIREKYFQDMSTVMVSFLGGIAEADTVLTRQLKAGLSTIAGAVFRQPAGGALDGAIALGKQLFQQQQHTASDGKDETD